jgi:hypothetical protein
LLQEVSQRKIRFTSTHESKELLDKIEISADETGLQAQRGRNKVLCTRHPIR